jgi:Domain of unknown function (DUF5615)
MDVHVPRAITDALRLRDIDVLTAAEDGSRRLTDSELLDRATALARVLFTRDADLLAEATRRQRTGQSFSGIVFGHQLLVSIGQCVHDLELLAVAVQPSELADRVQHLPLR